MKILPILWAEPPTAEDWARLSAAREAIGYTELIKPVQALPGSPGTILAIGALPSWLTPFSYAESVEDAECLELALSGCLGDQEEVGSMETLISSWMGVEVKQVGEEEYVKPELG